MNENIIEKQPVFRIETIKVQNGGEVSFYPDYGVIFSVKINGKEIIHFDKEMFEEKKGRVKGGIPPLFPNAGPLTENSNFPGLPQHGFARDSKWQTEKIENGFKMILSSNEETKKMYPYDFIFSTIGVFNEDGSFTLTQEVENLDDKKEMPVSFGLHPYFEILSKDKKDIKFNFDGGKFIEEQVEIWANGKAVSIDNPKVKDSNAVIEVILPEEGTLVIDASPEYKKIWVWSMENQDFVCIEPVLRNKNGLIDDPEMVKPKGKFSANVSFQLKK
jgi:galactose mutarotase-like enzyme